MSNETSRKQLLIDTINTFNASSNRIYHSMSEPLLYEILEHNVRLQRPNSSKAIKIGTKTSKSNKIIEEFAFSPPKV